MLKINSQLTFGMQEELQMRQKKTMLDDIEQIIDFRQIEEQLNTLYESNIGRPAIPPLMLFKMLLLEQWYNLSDVRVVEEIHDRRSFERFVGQEVRMYHVDDTTLVKFRERLRKGKMEKVLFAIICQQLEDQGRVIHKGTIIDSTIVQGATKPGRKKKNGELVDSDVTCTRRGEQLFDGFKVHVSMDQDSELISDIQLTCVTVHDHQVFEELIPSRTRMVYADKAYDSKEHCEYLASHQIQNGILRKGHRYNKLKDEERERNKILSRVRAAVEHKINDLKRWCHLQKLRYYGIQRNLIQVVCAGIAANLKRSVILMETSG